MVCCSNSRDPLPEVDLLPAVTGGRPFRVFAPALAAALLAAVVAQAAAVAPRGTALSVRLTTGVSSRSSRPGDPVEALLIAPLRAGDDVVLPAGGVLRGRVVARRGGFGRRAALRLRFDEMVAADGRRLPIDARVAEVDNAREQVAPDGTIRGLGTFTSRPSTLHLALLAAAHAHPVTLALLELGRFAKEKAQRDAVEYRPGVELELALQQPVEAGEERLAGGASSPLEPIPVRTPPASLQMAVEGLPLLTVSPKTGRTSDLTNVLLVGSREDVESAFAAAGWARASDLHPRTAVHGLLALMGHRGYDRAPVSRMEIGGRPPDLVFEKQCNTLTKRHHVRLWGNFPGPGGRQAWLGAASHDVGIEYSHPERRFTHRVDPRIDRERTKLVDDLSFAGRVAGTALLERPRAPRVFTVAAGETVETDGRIAVVLLETQPGPTTTVAANVSPETSAR